MSKLYVFAGAPKSGSTWLYEQFGRHPSVTVARIKDPFYFDLNHRRGDDWYWSLFGVDAAVAPPGTYADLSHDYLYAPDFPGRCAETARRRGARPFVHLVLRHPIDRFVSAVHYQVSFEGERRPGALDEAYPELLALSLYSRHVERVTSGFPPGAVRIDVFDDLAQDPAAFIGGVCRWLEVPATGSWLQSEPSRARRAPRRPALAGPARQAGMLLRRAGLVGLVERAKSSTVLEQFFFRPADPGDDPIDANILESLRDVFAPDVATLSCLLDRDLGELWGFDR